MKLVYDNLQGLGEFAYGNHYHTSSEFDASQSLRWQFEGGSLAWGGKQNARFVRAIRSF
jgi:hypothetical protein